MSKRTRGGYERRVSFARGRLVRLVRVGAFVALVAALTGVAAALAANSATYPDRAGDSGAAADITLVSVSSDDAGLVTVRVEFPGRPTLSGNDGVALGLDVDQNPDTGSIFYGTEYVIVVAGNGGYAVQRAVRRTFERAFEESVPPASLQVTLTAGAATIVFNRADFGMSGGGFNFFVDTERGQAVDFTPDFATVNYQFVAGTPPPPLARDALRPMVRALPATGKRGRTARLFLRAADNRNEARADVQISRRGRIVGRSNTSFRQISAFYRYYITVRVPRSTPRGRYQFCIRLVDRAGLRSPWSCARLTVS